MIPGLGPICVDLDGTLVPYDTSIAAWKRLALRHPFFAIKILFKYFFLGERYAKTMLGGFAPKSILHSQLAQDLLEAKKQNRKIILATGASMKTAKKISNEYSLFDHLIATEENFHCIGSHKAKKIKDLLGNLPFVYIADHWYDFPIWKNADILGVVKPSKKLLKQLKKTNKQILVYA